MPASPRTPLEGDQLIAGRYRLRRRLGAGSSAEVWEAADEVLSRPVAVKLLHPGLAADPDVRRRFRQEGMAAARLHHPNIVRVFDTCVDDVEALVLELVAGRTLRDELAERGRLEPATAVRIGIGVASGLAHAHQHGLVHRDVKPANVLLAVDGRVLLSDLGMARVVEGADATSARDVAGTARYLAPEVLDLQPATPASDVYSLGVVLFEALCGRSPFEGEGETATALARLHRPPLRARQVRPDVPRELDLLLDRLLARDPSRRPLDGAVAHAELQDLAVAPAPGGFPAPPPAPAGPVTPPAGIEPSFRESERRWLAPAMGVVLVAVALGVAGLLFGRTSVGRDLLRATRDAVTGGGEPSTVTVASAAAFDPAGDGHEHDSRAPAAIDGDEATVWTTERYSSADLGTKAGVGLVLNLAGAADLRELQIVSPQAGWVAEVHLADAAASTMAGWGAPVARIEAAATGRTTVLLGDRPARSVLVWITRLGDDGPPHRVEIAEVELRG